jgi:5-methylcytosine-specific restriction enzyme A
VGVELNIQGLNISYFAYPASHFVEAKKREVVQSKGRLACEACGFDFKDAYGDRGDGFIEAHHAMPLHTLLPGTKTRLVDLHLLCANCHRMVHSRRPWLTLDQLRNCMRASLPGA